MITFQQALAYLKLKGITSYDLFLHSGQSAGSLTLVFDGTTKNPRRKTKDMMIAYAEDLMKKNKENHLGESLLEDTTALYKNDKNYIKKLAIEVRANKDMLLKEPIFADLIYMEALTIALKAKKGDVIDINEFMKLRPR